MGFNSGFKGLKAALQNAVNIVRHKTRHCKMEADYNQLPLQNEAAIFSSGTTTPIV